MPAAIYARYSSDSQRETSIDDQVAQAQAFAQVRGFGACKVFSDSAQSGATPIEHRDGALSLMAAAKRGEFEVLLVESLNRLSRDVGDLDRAIKRLEYWGVTIYATDGSYHSAMAGGAMQRVMQGMMGEMQLKELRDKTHRGLTGQFNRGFAVTGKVYGYAQTKGEHGTTLAIDEGEADIVRRIYSEYSAGKSVRSIAIGLNRELIKSPRGGEWGVSTIAGSAHKDTGILRNPLYCGRIVWNKTKWIKDPESGKRNPRAREASELLEREAPALRIIDAALLAAVKARLGEPSSIKYAPTKTLFAGVLRCGLCSGSMIAVNAFKYGCARRKDKGTCAGILVHRDALDSILLDELKKECLSETALSRFVKMAQEHASNAGAVDKAADTRRASKRREVESQIAKLIDALATVGSSPAIADRLKALENEQAQLSIAPAPHTHIDWRVLVEAYKVKVQDLKGMLAGNAAAAKPAIKQIFGEVVIKREPTGIFATVAAKDKAPYLGLVAGAGFVNGLHLCITEL
jgi:DNA invertase Pin-like site-specific DNA recombinase